MIVVLKMCKYFSFYKFAFMFSDVYVNTCTQVYSQEDRLPYSNPPTTSKFIKVATQGPSFPILQWTVSHPAHTNNEGASICLCSIIKGTSSLPQCVFVGVSGPESRYPKAVTYVFVGFIASLLHSADFHLAKPE